MLKRSSRCAENWFAMTLCFAGKVRRLLEQLWGTFGVMGRTIELCDVRLVAVVVVAAVCPSHLPGPWLP
jgi:hypothetical protein